MMIWPAVIVLLMLGVSLVYRVIADIDDPTRGLDMTLIGLVGFALWGLFR